MSMTVEQLAETRNITLAEQRRKVTTKEQHLDVSNIQTSWVCWEPEKFNKKLATETVTEVYFRSGAASPAHRDDVRWHHVGWQQTHGACETIGGLCERPRDLMTLAFCMT